MANKEFCEESIHFSHRKLFCYTYHRVSMLSESFEGKDRVIGLNHNITHFISLGGEGKAREGGRNIAIHFKCISRVYTEGWSYQVRKHRICLYELLGVPASMKNSVSHTEVLYMWVSDLSLSLSSRKEPMPEPVPPAME